MFKKSDILPKRQTYTKDYIGWKHYAVMRSLLCLLPLWVGYVISSLASEIMFIFARRDRRIVENNLGVGLGLDKKVAGSYARRIFHNFGKNMVDFLYFPKFNEKWFKAHLEIEGYENLKQAFNLGRGAIVVSAHIGNLELGAWAILMCGFPTNAIWAAHKNPKVNEFFLRPRIEKGIKLIPTGGAVQKLVEALRAKEVACFAIDHSYSGRGVEVELLGHKAVIPTGAAIAALETAAPIVPAVAVRKGNSMYKAIIGKTVEYNLSGDKEKDIHEIMQQCAKSLEQFIRAYPDQWVLFRRFCNE